MYPLRDGELGRERASGIQLRASATDGPPGALSADEPFADDPFIAKRLDAVDRERETLAPPAPHAARRSDAPRRSDPSAAMSEVVFRTACGDHQGAMTAGKELMDRVPVLLMAKGDLRAEPLGYWDVHVLGQIDALTSLAELIDHGDVPPAEVLRVVCELVERKIIALR